MKTKRICILALLMACLLMATGAAAESIVGKWGGRAQVTGFPISLSVKVTFTEDGSFSLSCFGISASGRYTMGNGSVSVTPTSITGLLSSYLQSPEDIGQVDVPITLDGDALSMSASSMGFEGTMSLKRQ